MIAAALCTLCLYVGERSYHFDRDQRWNENNQMIGVEGGHVFALHYNNSYSDESTAVGYVAAWQLASATIGFKAGIVEGYGKHLTYWRGGAVAPFVLPELTLPLAPHLQLTVDLMPGQFISAGFKVNF